MFLALRERIHKNLWPLPLFLFAALSQKYRHKQAFLKLDLILGHDAAPQLNASAASPVYEMRLGVNQLKIWLRS